MDAKSFPEARECILSTVRGSSVNLAMEQASLDACAGRTLAADIRADRDYPAVSRSVRDGFAVRAADLPGRLRIIGEVRAGERFTGHVNAGEAVEIMTGAPLPAGADAVIMVEHVTRLDDQVQFDRTVQSGGFVNFRAAECRQNEVVIPSGCRLDFAHIALLATFGLTSVAVFKRPRIAILPTGDEIVDVNEVPRDYQVRNSNTWSLAAQVTQTGAAPVPVAVARDTRDDTRVMLRQALECDLVLLSGGVSAGRYDVVEDVLNEMGAVFYFDRVRIQPGQPLVFGQVQGKFFFGLPGNPASTMVTYQVLARAAVELLAGVREPALPLLYARLTEAFQHKPGLTRFLPSNLQAEGANVTPAKWQGSSDVPALARANAFLVADEDREAWSAGDLIRVLPR